MTDPRQDPTPKKSLPNLPIEEAVKGRDFRSDAEAIQLSSGRAPEDLKREAAEAEHNRTERFRDHFESLAIVTLYIAWAIVLIIALVWVYHLLAPPCWFHLPAEQVKQLQWIVTGGVFAGVVGGHIKRRLGPG